MFKNSGFTLVEILLVLGLLAVVAGLTMPLSVQWIQRSELRVAAAEVGQSLRRAQILAQAVDHDSNWGVDVRLGSVTLFQGSSYESRDTSFDEVFELSAAITPSGVGEVVFDTLTGAPQSTGDVVLTGESGQVYMISINDEGLVSY